MTTKIGQLAVRPILTKSHPGGDSRGLLCLAERDKLGKALRSAFTLGDHTKIAVELDPSGNAPDLMESMSSFGLTHASIGALDFDPVVQAAISRPQSFEFTSKLIEDLRAAGAASLTIDALYGLPLQTETRFRKTIQKAVSSRPDRNALFGFGHTLLLLACKAAPFY